MLQIQEITDIILEKMNDDGPELDNATFLAIAKDIKDYGTEHVAQELETLAGVLKSLQEELDGD